MANVKLGNNTLTGVTTVRLQNADVAGEYVSFNDSVPIEVSTAAAMTAMLVAANVGKVYKFTGTTDNTYTNGDLYEVVNE